MFVTPVAFFSIYIQDSNPEQAIVGKQATLYLLMQQEVS